MLVIGTASTQLHYRGVEKDRQCFSTTSSDSKNSGPAKNAHIITSTVDCSPVCNTHEVHRVRWHWAPSPCSSFWTALSVRSVAGDDRWNAMTMPGFAVRVSDSESTWMWPQPELQYGDHAFFLKTTDAWKKRGEQRRDANATNPNNALWRRTKKLVSKHTNTPRYEGGGARRRSWLGQKKHVARRVRLLDAATHFAHFAGVL